MRDLRTCVGAWNAEEYPTVCRYLRKDGKVIPIQDFQKEVEELKQFGIPKLHLVAGIPNKPREVSPYLVTIVPVLAFTEASSKRIGYISYLYAYSIDHGENWCFESLFKSTQQLFDSAHPDLKGALFIPPASSGFLIPDGVNPDKIETRVPNQSAQTTPASAAR